MGELAAHLDAGNELEVCIAPDGEHDRRAVLGDWRRRLVDRGLAPSTVNLAPAIDDRPDGDALKTFVCFLALYARDVDTGDLPGDPTRYAPSRGEHYARAALMPAHEFSAIQRRSDSSSPHTSKYRSSRSLVGVRNSPPEATPPAGHDAAADGAGRTRACHSRRAS